jgi:phosphatidylinositol 4-kinase
MLMLDTGLPCFRTDKILDSLRARFVPDKNDLDAAAHIRNVIRNSTVNYRTNLYDKIQFYQNKIPY